MNTFTVSICYLTYTSTVREPAAEEMRHVHPCESELWYQSINTRNPQFCTKKSDLKSRVWGFSDGQKNLVFALTEKYLTKWMNAWIWNIDLSFSIKFITEIFENNTLFDQSESCIQDFSECLEKAHWIYWLSYSFFFKNILIIVNLVI